MEKIKLDFFVIGVQKAGTTSLHDMLNKHPEIALPAIKETHFFSHAERMARGKQWYLDQFDLDNKKTLKGEIDPEYLYVPSAPIAIQKMTTVDNFIVILRNPLDRAFSQYQMSFGRGYEWLPFGDALAIEQERLVGEHSEFARDHWSYLSRSLYAGQIQLFLKTFPDARFLFLTSDTLSVTGYEQVCEFLRTQPVAHCQTKKVNSNTASAPRSLLLRNFLYARANEKSALRALLARVVNPKTKQRMFLWLDRMNQKPADVDRDKAFETVPEDVLTSFLYDLEKTELITGLDLSDWRRSLNDRLRMLSKKHFAGPSV